MAKRTAIERVMDAANKHAAKSAKRAVEGSSSDVREYLPTGITAVDWYLFQGCGGIPVGRVGEVFSDEGAGKTSFGFTVLAAAQRAGGTAVMIESEKTIQSQRAAVFGCNLDELVIVDGTYLGDVLNTMRDVLSVLDKTKINAIVWDSLAATEVSTGEDGNLGKSLNVGVRSHRMSQALPLLVRLALEYNAVVVVINQIRSKIGVIFGPTETTPGGNALKFHSTWRFQMWRGSSEKDCIYTTVKLVKSKVCKPLNKTKLKLKFESGWDDAWSTMNIGKDLKVVVGAAQRSKSNLELITNHLKGLKP
jgi:recombination protein RecA